MVRIVANEFSVPSDDDVYRTQLLGDGGDFIQIGDHIFFIGNGHIGAGKIAVLQEIHQFFRLFFKNMKFIIAQVLMDLGRIAVAQFPAQNTAFHIRFPHFDIPGLGKK